MFLQLNNVLSTQLPSTFHFTITYTVLGPCNFFDHIFKILSIHGNLFNVTKLYKSSILCSIFHIVLSRIMNNLPFVFFGVLHSLSRSLLYPHHHPVSVFYTANFQQGYNCLFKMKTDVMLISSVIKTNVYIFRYQNCANLFCVLVQSHCLPFII